MWGKEEHTSPLLLSTESQTTLWLSEFLVFSNMSKSHFLVETEREHVCFLCVYERERQCVCDGFTMCRVPEWDWMKSDMREPVRSGLLSETLLLLPPPPLPLRPFYIWRLYKTSRLNVIYNFKVTVYHLANVENK